MAEWNFEVGDPGNEQPAHDTNTVADTHEYDKYNSANDNSQALTCHNCGKSGHFKRECPHLPDDEARAGPGACFNCGEVGHNKADCPNPRVFQGACRVCGVQGHPAKECPERPAETCRNCLQEGHVADECDNNRKVDWSGFTSVEPDHAWNLLIKASQERELDDFREAFYMYIKSTPDATYRQMEGAFRSGGLGLYLIAMDKPVDEHHTIMNLQGKLGLKYTIGFFLSGRCPRSSLVEYWPATPEDNMQRLDDAGAVVHRFVKKCTNCGEVGDHRSRDCPNEMRTVKEEILCPNCNEPGHRLRECPKARSDSFSCFNCGQRGHSSKECPEPPNPDNVVCKACDKKGHFARDCPERPAETCHKCGEEGHRARDCSVLKCHNCDQVGHISKECPQPRDWSRVKCQNCGEMGHTRVRCQAAPKQDVDVDQAGGGAVDFGFDVGESGGGNHGGDHGGDAQGVEW